MNKMKKKVLMMTMAAATLSAVAQQPVDYVNPIIGTNGMGAYFSRCLYTFRVGTIESGHRYNTT